MAKRELKLRIHWVFQKDFDNSVCVDIREITVLIYLDLPILFG